jgi:hypothetical protein
MADRRCGPFACPHCGDKFKTDSALGCHFTYKPLCHHESLLCRKQPVIPHVPETRKRKKKGVRHPTKRVMMTDIVYDKNPTNEFEPLGFHTDSDSDNDDHGEFTKMSNLKNILLNNLSKSDFCALTTHFRDGEEEVIEEESIVEPRHDIETLDDEIDNGAGVDDPDEADLVYEGVQEAYDSVFVDQGHGTCTNEDRFALSLLAHLCSTLCVRPNHRTDRNIYFEQGDDRSSLPTHAQNGHSTVCQKVPA